MTHCTWNTGDGNMDFQKNLHLQERTCHIKRGEGDYHQPDLSLRLLVDNQEFFTYNEEKHSFMSFQMSFVLCQTE